MVFIFNGGRRLSERWQAIKLPADLQTGINLATARTPMIEQARLVERDVDLHQQLETLRYSQITRDPAARPTAPTVQSLTDAIASVQAQAHKDAQPKTHCYR